MTHPALDAAPPTEDPLRSDARVVEWYRLDASKRILRILVPSTTVLTLGSFLVAHIVAIERLNTLTAALGTLGLLMVIVGPLWTILGLKKVLEVEDYLLVRTDGVLEHVGHVRRLVPWDDLQSVTYDEADDSIVFHLADEQTLRVHYRFSGIGKRALAKRLEEIRRKAIWNLLPEQRMP